MNYMMMIYQGEDWPAVPSAEKNRVHEACGAWHEELLRSGRSQAAYALQPPSTATTLRGSSREFLVTDGPFIETKEVLGGFEIVACHDLDEALAVAKSFPALRDGYCRVEIRPLIEGNNCRD
jgi:hypothetical protein